MTSLNEIRYIVENIPYETKKIMITSPFPKMGKTTYSKLLLEKLNDFTLVDGDFYKPENLRIPDVIKLSSLEDLFLLNRDKKYIIDLPPLTIMSERGHFKDFLSYLKNEENIFVINVGKVTPIFYDYVRNYVDHIVVSPIKNNCFVSGDNSSWKFSGTSLGNLITNEIQEFLKKEFGFELIDPDSLINWFTIEYPVEISDHLLENNLNVEIVDKEIKYEREKSFCPICYQRNRERISIDCCFLLMIESKYLVTAFRYYLPICLDCRKVSI